MALLWKVPNWKHRSNFQFCAFDKKRKKKAQLLPPSPSPWSHRFWPGEEFTPETLTASVRASTNRRRRADDFLFSSLWHDEHAQGQPPATVCAITSSSLGVGAQVWEGSYLCVPSPSPKGAGEMKVWAGRVLEMAVRPDGLCGTMDNQPGDTQVITEAILGGGCDRATWAGQEGEVTRCKRAPGAETQRLWTASTALREVRQRRQRGKWRRIDCQEQGWRKQQGDRCWRYRLG